MSHRESKVEVGAIYSSRLVVVLLYNLKEKEEKEGKGFYTFWG